jgi:hypothetical protein
LGCILSVVRQDFEVAEEEWVLFIKSNFTGTEDADVGAFFYFWVRINVGQRGQEKSTAVFSRRRSANNLIWGT